MSTHARPSGVKFIDIFADPVRHRRSSLFGSEATNPKKRKVSTIRKDPPPPIVVASSKGGPFYVDIGPARVVPVADESMYHKYTEYGSMASMLYSPKDSPPVMRTAGDLRAEIRRDFFELEMTE